MSAQRRPSHYSRHVFLVLLGTAASDAGAGVDSPKIPASALQSENPDLLVIPPTDFLVAQRSQPPDDQSTFDAGTGSKSVCYAHMGCYQIIAASRTSAAAEATVSEHPRATSETQYAPLGECPHLIQQELQINLEVLRRLGMFPQRDTSCTFLEAPPVRWRGNFSVQPPFGKTLAKPVLQEESMFVLSPLPNFLSEVQEKAVVVGIVILWAFVWGIVVVRRTLSVFGQHSRLKSHSKVLRPELKAWESGFWSWVTISWATEWIQRFGNCILSDSDLRVQNEDFGRLGHPDDEARVCYTRFADIWRKEALRKGGDDQVSLWFVLLRFVSSWNLLKIFLLSAAQMMLRYAAGIYLVDTTINHILAVHRYQKLGGEYPRHLVVSVLVAIGGFWGLTVLRLIINTCASLVDGRICLRMEQAVRLAIYFKAQRLPVKCNEDKDLVSVNTSGLQQRAFGKEANLVNLVGYDVGMTISGSSRFLAEAAFTPVMICWLVYLGSQKLGNSIFVGLLSMVPLWLVMVGLACLQVRLATWRMIYGHERLQKLQEILDSIRIWKCFAWERAAHQEITNLRAHEVNWLWRFWIIVGALIQITTLFAHVFVVFTLLGHIWMYGEIGAPTIFVCLQILNNLKILLDVTKDKISNFLLIFPSMRRVEGFLRLAESPKCTRRPGEGTNHELTVQGDFGWQKDGQPVLHDLNIQIREGEKVAIVGVVGAGKTSLLHAMLGELWSSEDSNIAGPLRIAYCAQVPWIFEGTLRENVLFGTEYESERYKDVLTATALRKDIDILPGGDDVPIGSRGVTLSVGQKARISLARAAYCHQASLVLMDDPFSAVDAQTARHLLEKTIQGPLLKGRACVVCLQPDPDTIKFFDRVLVLEEGRVVFDGPPAKAETSATYRSLLAAADVAIDALPCNNGLPHPEESDLPRGVEDHTVRREPVAPLRDEEFQGRASWDTVLLYCCKGGWLSLMGNLTFSLVQIACFQMSNVAIARWSNTRLGGNPRVAISYILMHVIWVALSCFAFWGMWIFGALFSITVSKYMHDESVCSIIHAPISRFFDKHPSGRIMRRLSADLTSIDTQLFMSFSQVITSSLGILVPLLYIHWVMPFQFLLLCLPLYGAILVIVTKYWKVMVPLRYLVTLTSSDASAHFVEVRDQNVSTRAYNEFQQTGRIAIRDFDRVSSADFASKTSIKLWIDNTVEMLYCIQVTAIALIANLRPEWFGPGTMALCILNSFMALNGISGWINTCSQAQFEFISLHRVWELMPPTLPQEAAMELPGDNTRRNLHAKINREDTAPLKMSTSEGVLQIIQEVTGKAILQESSNGLSLVLAPDASFQELAPGCRELGQRASLMTQLVSANGVVRNAVALAEELISCACDSEYAPSQLDLELRSDWLAVGARLEVEDLQVCYGNHGPDIIRGISFNVEPGQRLAIVGTTGCGKTTLLLALLRIVEPRSGRVLLDGVDSQGIGLWALRSAIGLVPQNPVLLSGTLRYNLDPHGSYSDEQIWQALECVGLADIVERFPSQCDFNIRDAGGNLSFGQRQLLCLARVILRCPALVLLDETASGVDPKTREMVQQAITVAFHGSTVLAVAHRLETVMGYDLAIVLDKGSIIENGPVKELVSQNEGLFIELLRGKTCSETR